LMNESKEPLENALKQVSFHPPVMPVYSNTTGRPYDAHAAEEVVAQLSEHALKPVYFANQLQAMHDDGARIFVEVGPGSVLTGLTEATLKGRDFVAVNCDRPGKNSLEHFLSVIGLLAASGVAVDLSKLYLDRIISGRDKLEAPIAAGGKKLLYTVNSAYIQRLGGTPNAKAKVVATPVAKAAPAVAQSAPAQISNNGHTTKAPVLSTQTNGNGKRPVSPSYKNPNGQQSMDSNNKKSIPPMVGPGRADRDVDRVMLESLP